MAAFKLAALTALALVVFRAVDTGLYRLFAPSPLAMLADLRVTSACLLLALVLVGSARRVLALPRRPGSRIWPFIAGWLGGMVVSVRFAGIGRVPLPRWQDVVAFNCTGPLAEELLVRGLVLTAATRFWPPAGDRPSRAVLFSAAIFALMHLQYHAYRFDSASLAQVAWTFPMGILLGWIVERTGSLWPSLALHVLNNVLVQVV
jgi:membrane protease YdiL (CAAX protease family)